MQLNAEQINELLTDQYPRHVVDTQVSRLSSDRRPNDAVLLVFDEHLWGARDRVVVARSLTAADARRLWNQLGDVIDHLAEI